MDDDILVEKMRLRRPHTGSEITWVSSTPVSIELLDDFIEYVMPGWIVLHPIIDWDN